MMKDRDFPVPFSRHFAFANRMAADHESDLQHPGRSAKPWRATGSGGESAKPYGFNWNG